MHFFMPVMLHCDGTECGSTASASVSYEHDVSVSAVVFKAITIPGDWFQVAEKVLCPDCWTSKTGVTK